jgi:hypothetical protein
MKPAEYEAYDGLSLAALLTILRLAAQLETIAPWRDRRPS